MKVDEDPQRTIRQCNITGSALLFALFGGLGGWAAMTEIAGAVIAPGTLVVESNVKKVQHPTGGIVSEILIDEGDLVKAGQVLLRLNETQTKASLGITRSQHVELSVREARLLTERDGKADIPFPDALNTRDSATAEAIAGEVTLFRSRRDAINGQKAQLRERVAQVNEEIAGLSAQLSAKNKELKFITEELVGVADLYSKNLVTLVRYNQLQRDEARIDGERGHILSEVARARGRISELELQVLQLEQNFKSEVVKELRELQGQLAEINQKIVVASDQFDRVEIRAPQGGIVQQLAVHTVGGVVGPGEIIMQIVPRTDDLVLEVRVELQDIDQIDVGAKVNVRVMAGNQRTTPDIDGTVNRKAVDTRREQQSNHSYYLVRIGLDADYLQQHSDLKLLPGMMAQAYIRTQDRTPLQYLLKPLTEQIAKTFRER